MHSQMPMQKDDNVSFSAIDDRLNIISKRLDGFEAELRDLGDRIFGSLPHGLEARKYDQSPLGHFARIYNLADLIDDQMNRINEEISRLTRLSPA